jgi:hypothetical protein
MYGRMNIAANPSQAVRLELCRQSTVLVAKSSAQGNPLSDIGSVKDCPHLAVSG